MGKQLDYDTLIDHLRRMMEARQIDRLPKSGYAKAIEDVAGCPTVDAVPVVRCRDCVYYNTTGCSTSFGWCEDVVVNACVWDEFYCADGKRREDDA